MGYLLMSCYQIVSVGTVNSHVSIQITRLRKAGKSENSCYTFVLLTTFRWAYAAETLISDWCKGKSQNGERRKKNKPFRDFTAPNRVN